MNVRKLVTIVEEVNQEGDRDLAAPIHLAFVGAVIANPWAGQGFVEDLGPVIEQVAPELGALLAPRLVDALPAQVEAYGKAGVVGLNGDVEHASGLLHTLRFGNHLRDAVDATTLLPAVEKRGGEGTVFDVPLKHITDATVRSHHQTLEVRIPDAPHPDEILIGLAGSTGGRPHARLAAFRPDEA
ncbi:MAG: amino acid synthesis family protein [Actinobacteria bacterium]|nr:amino acid synthesis family protein [Actinomycetota bacterium]